jgi:hypothetical protein
LAEPVKRADVMVISSAWAVMARGGVRSILAVPRAVPTMRWPEVMDVISVMNSESRPAVVSLAHRPPSIDW